MPCQPDDLVRLAQLIKLSADTAKLFSNSNPESGRISRITQLAQQIEAAALELMEIGKTLEELAQRTQYRQDGGTPRVNGE